MATRPNDISAQIALKELNWVRNRLHTVFEDIDQREKVLKVAKRKVAEAARSITGMGL